ncbi:hypothetical protein EWB00_005977 [Schistosoma japonicum]|uniref:Uncharacterized protein n=1 Tax=Schistosoma japonicum TaxID=6182 RepID=A0A4Z2DT93_SCHJA|nr:glutaredoxin 3 [Schistosoma japonicum]KAH8853505.1 glutaredoxin 3 [Schistosoma japonicum]TNN19746.1 hypothetical protein EWB00_005977 [Schistosoma japonicum]
MQYFTNMCSTNFIDAKIKQRRVLLISKQKVPICQTIEGILGRYNLNRKQNDNFEILYIDARKDCGTIETYLWHKLIYRDRQVPHLFLDGKHIGGESEIKRLHESGEMRRIFAEVDL